MSVMIHMAGSTTAEAIPKLREAVAIVRPMLERSAGYERAELLVNHAERKVQVLLQWRSFDEGMAFLKGNGLDVFMPFTGLMQNTLGPAFFAIEGVA